MLVRCKSRVIIKRQQNNGTNVVDDVERRICIRWIIDLGLLITLISSGLKKDSYFSKQAKVSFLRNLTMQQPHDAVAGTVTNKEERGLNQQDLSVKKQQERFQTSFQTMTKSLMNRGRDS